MSLPDEGETQMRLSELFDGMMRAAYDSEGAQLTVDILASDRVKAFIEAHATVLDSSFSQVEMTEAMRRRLHRSDFIFSGLKTFHELNEVWPLIFTSDGTRRTFEQFLDLARKTDGIYNRNYLRAEYNFIASSAEMAAKWETFAADGDRYNLQYRTHHDDRVRPEHAALDGVTLPPSDPFWAEFYPPNGWNCRCTVVQVRPSKYPATDREEAVRRGNEALQRDTRGLFRFNPGIEGSTVPKYNPYTIRRCRDCDIAKGRTSLARMTPPDNQLCEACRFIRHCECLRAEIIRVGTGEISINNLVNREDNDFERLMQVARHFAALGERVMLTPKMTRPAKFDYDCVYGSLRDTMYYTKCPDLKIGNKWYEHEGFSSDNPKNAFRNMLNHGLKQSDNLIIDKPELTDAFMKRIIQQRIKDGQRITEIWVNENGNLRLLYKKSEE